jgi:hypothetical protein
MRNVTLSFPSRSEMAFFVIDLGISNFVADWKNASLTSNIEDSAIHTAFTDYNAFVIENEPVRKSNLA